MIPLVQERSLSLEKLWAAPIAFALWADSGYITRSTWTSPEFKAEATVLQIVAQTQSWSSEISPCRSRSQHRAWGFQHPTCPGVLHGFFTIQILSFISHSILILIFTDCFNKQHILCLFGQDDTQMVAVGSWFWLLLHKPHNERAKKIPYAKYVWICCSFWLGTTSCHLLLEKCALLGITARRAKEPASCADVLPHLSPAICHLGIILLS